MLPYLRLFIPDLTLEKKRTLVSEITEALIEALHLPPIVGEWCTIHLVPLKSDCIAIGGKLVADGAEPSYLVEVTDRELNQDARQAIVDALKPLLSRHLGLRPDQSFDLNFKFSVCEAKDFAIGGQFLSEYHERQAMALPLNHLRQV